MQIAGCEYAYIHTGSLGRTGLSITEIVFVKMAWNEESATSHGLWSKLKDMWRVITTHIIKVVLDMLHLQVNISLA